MKHFVNSHHVHVLQVRGHTVHISVPSEWVGRKGRQFGEIEVKPIPLKYIEKVQIFSEGYKNLDHLPLII